MCTKDLIIKSATNFYDELKRDKNGRYDIVNITLHISLEKFWLAE